MPLIDVEVASKPPQAIFEPKMGLISSVFPSKSAPAAR
jgi:hypothetical protein